MNQATSVVPTQEQSASNSGHVRHLVLVRFQPSADAASVQGVIDHFAHIQHEIAGIVAFEHGANNSPERKNKGLEHAFMLTFESAAARDAYLPHPAHQPLSARLRSVIDDLLVIDYALGAGPHSI